MTSHCSFATFRDDPPAYDTLSLQSPAPTYTSYRATDDDVSPEPYTPLPPYSICDDPVPEPPSSSSASHSPLSGYASLAPSRPTSLLAVPPTVPTSPHRLQRDLPQLSEPPPTLPSRPPRQGTPPSAPRPTDPGSFPHGTLAFPIPYITGQPALSTSRPPRPPAAVAQPPATKQCTCGDSSCPAPHLAATKPRRVPLCMCGDPTCPGGRLV